ncbi:MAG: AAA family ATPase, partial [Bacillota bacterium]
RRLFEHLGDERIRRNVARAFADWCFERRAQLPPEWTAVDTAATEARAREFLRSRFEACYPFHPATLSVFQRKWQALPQYQQTRGTLAMLAQWISWAYKEGFTKARREPLITLGSAPLDVPTFRSLVLGQLGESRLVAAIDADIAGDHSHAKALDADSKGALSDIHRRVGIAILFESSGGQTEKVAHLPELRFALGGPEVDTTSIDNAALALEDKSYFIRKVGSDGFKIGYRATLKKVVNDRRASLDEENEIRPALRRLVEDEFRRGASTSPVFFPSDSVDIPDAPRLTLVVLDPEAEWAGSGSLREQVAERTRQRGKSPRLYPGALVWCIKKPGRDLRDKVELWLAWRRVEREIADGTLGSDFDQAEKADVYSKVATAGQESKDEVWASYRFVVVADNYGSDGLKVIDLGAGHSSSGETLCGRVVSALKSEGLLSESVGAGYIERNWPPALKESGAWPLASLRQSFLNGSLTRLLDPDTVLRNKIVEFVARCDFGLASAQKPDGTYERVWFQEPIAPEEVAFESRVFLLTKTKAQVLKAGAKPEPVPSPEPGPFSGPGPVPGPAPAPWPGSDSEITPELPAGDAGTRTIHITGTLPPEVWNRLGTRILPKLRSGSDLRIGVDFSVVVDTSIGTSLVSDLRQILNDLGLADRVGIDEG